MVIIGKCIENFMIVHMKRNAINESPSLVAATLEKGEAGAKQFGAARDDLHCDRCDKVFNDRACQRAVFRLGQSIADFKQHKLGSHKWAAKMCLPQQCPGMQRIRF